MAKIIGEESIPKFKDEEEAGKYLSKVLKENKMNIVPVTQIIGDHIAYSVKVIKHVEPETKEEK